MDDQCIFIRGYRIKRVFFELVPWLRGAAEPKPDPHNDPEPETEVVPTSSVTEVSIPFFCETFLHHIIQSTRTRCTYY